MLISLLTSAALSSYPSFADFAGASYNVSYDSRAIKLNGEHALFISGAVHPPRGTPSDWASWFDSARQNGLNMLQVYVFWNFHEEVEGEFNFEGRGNLSEFVRLAGAAGMFVNLRIGPYVCAEWTYGGLPTWLGLKPGVAFRQTNPVWQPAMQKFFNGIVERMAAGGLFATQGGPIVLVQVENELPDTDKTYVEWCGTMAHAALDAAKVDVPVTMCNGETASTAINTARRRPPPPARPPPRPSVGCSGRVRSATATTAPTFSRSTGRMAACWSISPRCGPRTKVASRRGAARHRRARSRTSGGGRSRARPSRCSNGLLAAGAT